MSGLAAAGVAVAVVGVLPSLDINKIMKDFRPSTTESDTNVSTALAASYGTMTSESIKKMDDKLKVAIAGTVKALSKLKIKGTLSWEHVVACMTQNPLLERTADNPIHRSRTLKKEGDNFFKFDGSPSRDIKNEVHAFIQNLIQDGDVFEDLKLDEDSLANIVAWTGATVTNFLTVFGKEETHEKKILDVGVLRYPDIQRPFFKVYRLQLVAWSDCTRILFYQHDANGINGDFNSMNFKPREEVIAGLKKETFDQAVQEAESMFD